VRDHRVGSARLTCRHGIGRLDRSTPLHSARFSAGGEAMSMTLRTDHAAGTATGTRLTEAYWPATTSPPLTGTTVGDLLREAAADSPGRWHS